MRRILLFTGAGAIAGFLTSVISTPFYKSSTSAHLTEAIQNGSVDVRGFVTYGTTFGIVSDLALGALVTAILAFLLARRESVEKRFVRALIGAVVGATLYTLVDKGLDLSFINAIHARRGSYFAPYFEINGLRLAWEPLWGFLLPAAIALSVLVAHGFRRYYLGLGLWATLFGGLAGMVGRTIAAAILLPIFIGKIFSAKDPTSIDISSGGATEFTAMFIANGAGLGLGFAFAVMVYKTAWLKSVKGQTEGRTWTLQGPLARIGCYEGNEVFLPPDGTVAPVHAQIQSQDEAHFLVDLVGDTALNSQPVQSAWLKDGDRIGVGASTLVYRTRLDSKNHPAQTPAIELPKSVPLDPVPPQDSVAIPYPNPEPVAAVASPTQARIVQLKLVDEVGHEFLLREGSQTVGRDESCDIVMAWEQSVSRKHAEISVNAGVVTVTDLGSTNGTFVNGAVISAPTLVTHGSQIAFGKCQLRLSVS